MNTSGVVDAEKQTILRAIRKHFPNAVVLFFGSRLRGDHKKYSDLDISINNQQPLDLAELSSLKEDFSLSDLPFKVDIVDWNRITDEFREVIRSEAVEWIV